MTRVTLFLRGKSCRARMRAQGEVVSRPLLARGAHEPPRRQRDCDDDTILRAIVLRRSGKRRHEILLYPLAPAHSGLEKFSSYGTPLLCL